ncbi:hypothetical protein BEWA_013760 [Theileria equi strain WA]|uniref:Uncharacterized protein n=1 Tax=Theileria equi strain WA TaxID=1537102 RepID=L1LBM3_THEEQ|nr:hypothetical protein BEWA_013760 [Theileria equi strain WA]EKX72817.1 hypothetical protein BEWA_013760 [Theileria equi strain WA]|eukprot:XP_004832269.1 hypothetical protein BEWA_013760 [Theileria equi strain WA]
MSKNINLDISKRTENDEDVFYSGGKFQYFAGNGYVTLVKKDTTKIKVRDLEGALREEKEETLKGYRVYDHIIPNNLLEQGYYLNAITYDGKPQKGFYDISLYATASVFFFSHDEENSLPLLIKLTRTIDDTSHIFDYYRFTGKKKTWSRENITNGSQLFTRLPEIATDLEYPLVLNLDSVGEYCINGQTTTKNFDYRIPKVRSELQSEYINYQYRKHSVIVESQIRLVSTVKEGNPIPFKRAKKFNRSYSEINVYYWELDYSYSQPLLIQLGNEDEFYTIQRKTWKIDHSISSTTLYTHLEKKSCKYNDAHIIDISNPNDYYFCSNCHGKMISVRHEKNIHQYDRHLHTIDATKFSISGFKDSQTPQSGLPSAKDVSNVCVYSYVGTPFLLQINQEADGHSWYRRGENDKWIVSLESLGEEDKIVSNILAETLRDPELKGKFLETAYHALQRHKSSEGSDTSSESSNLHTVSSREQNSTNTVAAAAGGTVGGVTVTGLGTLELYNFFTNSTRSVTRIILATFSKPM